MSLIAQHHGRCPECETDIVPGQRIESVDDAWQHEICGATAETTTECACEKCWLVHVGECPW
jgi:hypothetical protein